MDDDERLTAHEVGQLLGPIADRILVRMTAKYGKVEAMRRFNEANARAGIPLRVVDAGPAPKD